ncbi:MAG TPA: PglZ domain-containing protein, partial [Planctomycetaceae bacterium]
IPATLASVGVAQTTTAIEHCARLAKAWRNDREARASYVAAAQRIDEDIGLAKLEFDGAKAAQVETFLSVERSLLRHVENSLLTHPTRELLGLAAAGVARFWAEAVPAIQARWALVASAAEVLLEADRVAKALKNPPASVPALVKVYAEGDDPWCLLDTHHRRMESRKFAFEFATDGEHDSLDKLVVKAAQRYAAVGSELARYFVAQLQKAKYPIQGLLRQRDIYETQVKPQLEKSKVAYVWVDALRFEMARELGRLLKDDFEVAIQPALGIPPTITEIGMAALLPGAHESAKVVAAGNGKLALEIDGTVIRDRKERVAFLKSHAGVSVFDAKLDDLLPKASKKIKEGIEKADLILITSQEIDELGEQDNISQARLQVDGILGHLRRGVRILAENGVKTIVVVADHGHLFADEIGDDMKIEAPGGKAEDLHRRVWVGVGGTSEPSYLRMPLSLLGVESDLDLATPWTFACFKTKGGGRAYFHGGLSPQELIIPVMTLAGSAREGGGSAGFTWKLAPGSAKLTTRFFSVQIHGQQSGASLFGLNAPRIRLEVRANKKCVSVPVSASYGYEDATGEVALKLSETESKRIEPNTVTVMITGDVTQKTVSVVMLDATTGVELTHLDSIEVAISI